MPKFRTRNRPYDDDGRPNSYFSDTTSESGDERLGNVDAGFNNFINGSTMVTVSNTGQDFSSLNNDFGSHTELAENVGGFSEVGMHQDLAGIGARLDTPTGPYPPKIDDADLVTMNIPNNIDTSSGMVGENDGANGCGNGYLSVMNGYGFTFSTPTRNGRDFAPLDQPHGTSEQYGDLSDDISPLMRGGHFASDHMMHGTIGFGDFIPQNQEVAFRLNEEDAMGPSSNHSFTENQFIAQMTASNRRVMEQGGSSQSPHHANAPSEQLMSTPSRRSGCNLSRNAGDAATSQAEDCGFLACNTGYQTGPAAANAFDSPFATNDSGPATGNSIFSTGTHNNQEMDAEFMYQGSHADANRSAGSSLSGSQVQVESTGPPSLQGSSKGKSKVSNKSDGGDSPYVEDEELSDDESPSRKRKRGSDKKGTSSSTSVAAINKDGQRRKARAPRPPLRKWADKDLSLALLGIVWACGESGLQIPFAQAAQLVDVNCTAGALQQAILKLHEAGVEVGLQLPKIKMHWTKKPNSTATSNRDPTSRPRRKPTLRQIGQVLIITLKRAYVEEARAMLPYPYNAGLTGFVPLFELDPAFETEERAAGPFSAGPSDEQQSTSLNEYKPNFPEVFTPKAPANTAAKRQFGTKAQSSTANKGQSNTKGQSSINTRYSTQVTAGTNDSAQQHGSMKQATRGQSQGFFDQGTQDQPQGYFDQGMQGQLQGYATQGNRAYLNQGNQGYMGRGTQGVSGFDQETTFANYGQPSASGYMQPHEHTSAQQSFGITTPNAFQPGFSTPGAEQTLAQQQFQADPFAHDLGSTNWDWSGPLDEGNPGDPENGEPMHQDNFFDMESFYTDKGI